MFQKIRYLLGKVKTRPIFVIGCGRSGTHWVGRTLKGHPEIRATFEANPMFRWSTQMALDRSSEEKLLGRLLFAYGCQLFLSAPRHFLAKDHPNIWIAEALKQAFPGALFLAIERHPLATVASMLRHRGVAGWHHRWRDFPVPNRFLGISADLAEHYDELPRAAQCAHRWLAHHRRLRQLQDVLGDDLLTIQYEELAQNPAAAAHNMRTFLRLQSSIPAPEVKIDSLDKWKQQLTPAQISQIAGVVGNAPDELAQRENDRRAAA